MAQVYLQGGSWESYIRDDGGLAQREVLVLPKRGAGEQPAQVELYAGSEMWHTTPDDERLRVRVLVGVRDAS